MDSNIIKNILLIGAGQLGSRHLQGLLRLENSQKIYVLDTSQESLDIARKRAEEISNNHFVSFLTNWGSLPLELNLVIIATGANVREEIINRLLNTYKVNYLILEKVLFQQLESYKRVENLIIEKQVSTWVNHPRRMMKPYQIIKNTISESNEIVSFQVYGGNWGLACNGLHFIDLCTYLTGTSLQLIEENWMDNIIYESKRPNCIEFTGILKGTMVDNSSFIINSLQGEQEPITIYISTKSHRWMIQEGSVIKVIHLSKENSFNEHISSFNMEFQSILTTQLAQNLLEFGACDLPTYKEACLSHVPFIKALLKKYNKLTGTESKICPIT